MIEGDVQWTKEGQIFSWRVMSLETVPVSFQMYTDAERTQKLSIDKYIHQRWITVVPCDPYLVWRTARFLCKKDKLPGIWVKAICRIGVPGETKRSTNKTVDSAYIVDPKVNLCKISYRYFSHNPWVSKDGAEGKEWLEKYSAQR